MKHRNRKIILVLPLLLLLVACNDKFRQAAQAVNDYSIALSAFQEAEITAHSQGFVDDATHKSIQGAVVKLGQGGQALSTAIRTTKSTPGTVAAVNAALDASNTLINDGLAGVKNPQTKASLTALVLGLRAPLTLIASLFGGVS